MSKTNYVSLSFNDLPEDKISYLLEYAQGFGLSFSLSVSEAIPYDLDDISTQISNNFYSHEVGEVVAEDSLKGRQDLIFDDEVIGTVVETSEGLLLGSLTCDFEEYVRKNKIQDNVNLRGESRDEATPEFPEFPLP